MSSLLSPLAASPNPIPYLSPEVSSGLLRLSLLGSASHWAPRLPQWCFCTWHLIDSSRIASVPSGSRDLHSKHFYTEQFTPHWATLPLVWSPAPLARSPGQLGRSRGCSVQCLAWGLVVSTLRDKFKPPWEWTGWGLKPGSSSPTANLLS